MSTQSLATLAYFRNALAPAYRVERLLGVGGTSMVYLAEDVKHERQVAIKVLRNEFSATVGAERFVREIRVAARLTHPHIIPLLDSGRAGNSPFYVMPFIDGESLRARLEREQRIPLAEAVALVAEVADALEYAHAADIVHRDVKPENIMLLRGHAVVADFGIARAIRQAASDARRTSTGLILGTPAYMSPEQAAGDDGIDGRSDIYSLATTFFEMITGAPPFSATTTQALIGKRFVEHAPRLSTMLPGVPATIDAIVNAALQLEPDDRPRTAGAFAIGLAIPGEMSLTSPAASAQRSSSASRSTALASNPALPSVAVLPFANLTGDSENEFLSDGITEEIMSTLSRLRTIRVAARASSFAFRDRTRDVREIAERLGVANILDGSVRRAGNRVRVTAQLVDAESGFPLWSDRFDRDLDDAFAIQDDVARAISDALSATLLLEHVSTRESVGGAAYESYLRGRYALNKRTESELRRAARLFETAMEQQPDFALPCAGLAEALVLLGVYGAEPPTEVMPKARTAVERALTFDPSLGDAYATLGAIRAIYDWDWTGADEAFRRATALSPRSPSAWQLRAMDLLLPLGKLDEARNAIDRARSLDPLAMVIAASVGVVYHLAGDSAGAVRALTRALEIDDGFAMTHYFLGGALRDGGDLEGAKGALRTAIAKSDGTPEMTAALAQVHAREGDVAKARALQAELTASALHRHVSPCLLAQVQAALGECDVAVTSLERAAEARDAELIFIGVRPAYAPLRGHPRFNALRARVGV